MWEVVPAVSYEAGDDLRRLSELDRMRRSCCFLPVVVGK